MPFLKDFIINENTKIKIWKINLGENDKLSLENYDRNLLNQKKNIYSKEQFLAIRKLIELENPNYRIKYNKLGKPLLNSNLNISISHSNEIAAVVFSKNKRIGIDVQLKKDKILNIRNKFLNKTDKLKMGVNLSTDILTMAWSTKEAIYKAISKKGVSFLKNILIDQISLENKNGVAHYINRGEKKDFNLKFFFLSNYTICFAYEAYY